MPVNERAQQIGMFVMGVCVSVCACVFVCALFTETKCTNIYTQTDGERAQVLVGTRLLSITGYCNFIRAGAFWPHTVDCVCSMFIGGG